MTLETIKRPIPRKLDEAMIIALSEYVAKGNYAQHACYLCGIDESTYYLWMKQAQGDIEQGQETIYTSLFKAVKRARAAAQAELIEVARNAASQKKDGYLAVTIMERTDPENWGRKDRIQPSGNTYNINIDKALVDASGKLEAALGQLAIREWQPGEVDNNVT